MLQVRASWQQRVRSNSSSYTSISKRSFLIENDSQSHQQYIIGSMEVNIKYMYLFNPFFIIAIYMKLLTT